MQHPVAAPTALVTGAGLAAVPWVSGFELFLRVAALVLSMAASWYAIKHYRK